MSQLTYDEMQDVMIELDGETFSLADIANVDMDDVSDNYGFEPTPTGNYDFEVEAAELTSVSWEDKDSGEDVTMPIIKFVLKVVAVNSLADADKSPEDVLNTEHHESFTLFPPIAKSAGKAKVLMRDAAGIDSGTVIDRLNEFQGKRFRAAVKCRYIKKTDRHVSNIDLRKIRPVEVAEETAS